MSQDAGGSSLPTPIAYEEWEVRPCVVVSTAHCPQAVANGELFTGDESWRLYGVTDVFAQYYLGSDLGMLREDNPCLELMPLFEAVLAKGFVEIRFDRDGPVVDGFPILFEGL